MANQDFPSGLLPAGGRPLGLECAVQLLDLGQGAGGSSAQQLEAAVTQQVPRSTAFVWIAEVDLCQRPWLFLT